MDDGLRAAQGTSAPRAAARRPCVRLLAAYAAGLVAEHLLPLPLEADCRVLIAVLACAAALAILLRRSRAANVAALTVLGAAGYLWAAAVASVPADDLALSLPEGSIPLEISGRVVSADIPPPPHSAGEDLYRRYRFVMDVESAAADEGPRALSGRVRVTVGERPLPSTAPGDRVRVFALVGRPRGPSIPGVFDYRTFLERGGVRTTAFAATGLDVATVERASPASPANALWRLRRRIIEGLRSSLPPEDAALTAALLLGDRTELQRLEQDKYYRSGVGHIFAVSGLHVGLVAGSIWFVLTRLGVGRKPSAAIVALAAVFYAALVGFQAPAVRAAVMTAAFSGAVLLEREADSLNVLAFAALVILIPRPLDLFQVGFQLSFVAVAFITLLYGRLESAWKSLFGLPAPLAEAAESSLPRRVLRGARRSLWVSLAATLGIWPLVLWHFGYVAVWSVPVNAVVVPTLWVVMVLGILNAALAVACPAAGWLLAWALSPALEALRRAVSFAAALPWSPVHPVTPHWEWIALYYALWAVILAGKIGPVRVTRSRAAAVALAAMNVFLAARLLGGAVESSRVDFLDAPGGAALVRTSEGRSVLIDAGDSPERPDVATFLSREGVSRLDLVAVTRDEPDAAAAASVLIGRLDAARVALPWSAERTRELSELEAACRERGIPAERLLAGDAISFAEGSSVEILAPRKFQETPSAAAGLRPTTALRVSLPEGLRITFARAERRSDLRELLFSAGGSRRAAAERPGVAKAAGPALDAVGEGLACDVLWIACDTRGGELERIIALAHPRYAVVCGPDLAGGSGAAAELVEKLARARVRAFVTGRDGTISLAREPGGQWVLRAYSEGRWRRLDAFGPADQRRD